MRYSSLTQRISPDTDQPGRDPWEVHSLALERLSNGEDVILLSIGQESDKSTPSCVVDAAISSLRNGHHHYTDVAGQTNLRQAVAEYHQHLSGQVVSAQQCVIYAGAQNALFAVSQVLLEHGQQVILSEPYYTTYQTTFSATGSEVVSVPLRSQSNYELTVSDIESAINDNTQMLVLNSPNNPMGHCYTRKQWQALVNLCVERDIWMVHDAVYADIVGMSPEQMPQSLPGAEQVLITVGSLSKSHRMTGWRLGWAVAPLELSEHLTNLSMCMHYGLPPFIMDAAVVALEDAKNTPRVIEKLLNGRRQRLKAHLAKLPVGAVLDSGTGMFLLLDTQKFELSGYEFALGLLNKHLVSVLPCNGFGATGKHLVRIGLCVDDARLDRAGKAIAEYCHSLKP
ncbi:MAG: pyridoxal phosphate-dependent aminotransferase [Gammaproteobacteria bacterium]|nr:pyridoxal phosphate-dependent aminotransferase [Gammaproteobacteria bacterium]